MRLLVGGRAGGQDDRQLLLGPRGRDPVDGLAACPARLRVCGPRLRPGGFKL